jgi:PAS domain S-box-containing protein
MLGYAPEEIAGLTYAEVSPEPDAAANREAFTALRDGRIDRFTIIKRYRRKDGSEFTGRLNVSGVRDDDGRLVRAISQVEDITASNEAERALAISEERFRALVEHSPDTIFVTDIDGGIASATAAAHAQFGMPEEALVGANIFDLVHPDERPAAIMQYYEAMKRPGAAIHGEVRMRHASGGWRWIEIIVTDHLHTAGIGGLVWNQRDITERKQADLALAEAHRLQGKALADLRESDAVRNDFISFLSHEFRTPLTSISGYAQLLELGNNSEEDVQQFSGVITRETARLTDMVRDLLTLDRAERHLLTLEREPFDINEEIRERIAALRGTWRARDIVEDLDATLPDAEGDRRLLGQVLTNLIANALTYSPDGGPVTVSTRRDEGMLHVAVRDEGIGIPAAELDRIFDRFHRVREGQARFIPGNGLGLAIVREIVMLHGGRVWVESIPGNGSTFHLLLPFA